MKKSFLFLVFLILNHSVPVYASNENPVFEAGAAAYYSAVPQNARNADQEPKITMSLSWLVGA